jgi:multiple sugar transport system substrate-binding protein
MTGHNTAVKSGGNPMSTVSRRHFLRTAGLVAGAGILGGCATGTSSGGGNGGKLVLQSSLSDPDPKNALRTIAGDYSGKVTLNTVAIEQFRAQLPTYLSSSNPPDVLTWYGGSVARDYAGKGLLLDVSDLWRGEGPCASYSAALKQLSTGDDGKQIFVPTNYYWWGVFYRKSAFAKWGVKPPTTWDEFLGLCEDLKAKNVHPLTMGTASTPWTSSGWFDYLNLRINGPKFHRELLAGKHKFDSEQVRAVMDHYGKLLPYFDPDGRSYAWQQAVTPLVRNEAAMYLIGAFVTTAVPTDVVDDLDFFQFPIIDENQPIAEEAPTDGYFASAKTKDPAATKKLLTYLAAPKTQQQYIELSKSSNLPTSSEVDTSKFSPLVQKGIALLNKADEITQFFNRDSSDELQTTADTALTRFMDKPKDVSAILAEWQSSAGRVFTS